MKKAPPFPLSPEALARLERRGCLQVRPGWTPHQDCGDELAALGLTVVPLRIDVEAFERYVRESGYTELSYWGGGTQRAATEKYLEHYVSLELLDLQPGDVVIDVASCTSPWPTLVWWRYGCRVFRQDLSYEPGIHEDRIGGDATRMPVPDGFADKMALHCSFEHFEEDRDSLFLREAERVLRPGGRLCILPLYMSRTYAIQTDLAAWEQREPVLDPRAEIYLAEDWGEVHGRFYDPERFVERVVRHLGGLRLQIFRIENSAEVAPDCYLRLAALFTKPVEEGDGNAISNRVRVTHPDVASHLERIHATHALGLRSLEEQLHQERQWQMQMRTIYEEQIERLEGAITEQRAHFEVQMEKLVRDHKRDRDIYEAEIRRIRAAHQKDSDAWQKAAKLWDLARESDRRLYQEEIRRPHCQQREEVARLNARHEDLALRLAELTAAYELEQRHHAETASELASIHRSKMWRLWMAYHAVYRVLLWPFRRLRHQLGGLWSGSVEGKVREVPWAPGGLRPGEEAPLKVPAARVRSGPSRSADRAASGSESVAE